MAAGVPIVASDLPALREVLRHEENALLARPATPTRSPTPSAACSPIRRWRPASGGRPAPTCTAIAGTPAPMRCSTSSACRLAGRHGPVSAERSACTVTRPRRVLVVTWELQPDSGWGRYSLGLVRGLLERGIEVTVLTERRSEAPPLDARVIPCLSTPLAPLDRPLPFAWNMAQVWRHAPGHDLVHFFVEPYALAASAVFPWPYLITVHGTYGVSPLRMNPVTRTLFARTMRRAGVGGLRQQLHPPPRRRGAAASTTWPW